MSDEAWRDNARCNDPTVPQAWFWIDPLTSHHRKRREGGMRENRQATLDHLTRAEFIARARRVCAGCAVREQCLEYALSIRERFNIYGGYGPEQRDQILVARRKRSA